MVRVLRTARGATGRGGTPMAFVRRLDAVRSRPEARRHRARRAILLDAEGHDRRAVRPIRPAKRCSSGDLPERRCSWNGTPTGARRSSSPR
jgi:hypothetical protein